MAASIVTSSSNDVTSFIDNNVPKFSEYRSRVMLGDLPSDFLRIELIESQIYDPFLAQQEHYQNENFLGHFTLTIAEAKLIKNSGPLGLLRMDPYVRFRIGHITHETPTATGGGKNPQWKMSYRFNLMKGMDRIHIEIYDQRSFTEDSFIGECDIDIPKEVLDGQTYQQWYSLKGKDTNMNENQGDILIIMSLTTPNESMDFNLNSDIAMLTENPPILENSSFPSSPTVSSSSSPSNSVADTSSNFSSVDVLTIKEMFPTIDQHLIIDLLEKYKGNKDLVVNHLLQN